MTTIIDAHTQTFLLPDLGEGLTEATVVAWHVAEGDTVAIDQIVVEVESAKSVVELPVPWAGVVAELCVADGEQVELGKPLIRIRTGAGDAAEAEAPAQPAASAAETTVDPEDAVSSEYSGAVLTGYGLKESTVRLARPEGGRFKKRSKCATDAASACADSAATAAAPSDAANAPAPETMPEPATASAPAPATAPGLIDPSRNSPVMSPLVRREAKQAGFDARHLEGSGPQGLVLRVDVERAIEARSTTATAAAAAPAVPNTPTVPAPVAATPAVGDQRIPVTGMRALVAEHMAQSHAEVPKATIWLDVDATPLLDFRTQLQTATGERFSLTTLVARIVIAGLQEHPRLNASFDAAANEIVEHSAINLGIAAQTPRGLTVPVVHGAEAMRLRELRDGITEIVEESGRGNFPPAKLAGGTFTVNNYGGFGVDGASPIINLPQAAMLGLGRLKERPWVVDGELAVRTVMTVSFVFDHRVCDGDTASAFLTFVTNRIEQPALLFADL